MTWLSLSDNLKLLLNSTRLYSFVMMNPYRKQQLDRLDQPINQVVYFNISDNIILGAIDYV